MPSAKSDKWKTHLGDLWDGRKVYVVDGEYVRDHYFADFVEGGNTEAYPELIPADEIWVEKLQTPVDLVESLVHEVVESTLMRYKVEKDYDSAHDATNTVSQLVRKIRHMNHGKVTDQMPTYPEADVQKAPKGEASMKALLK